MEEIWKDIKCYECLYQVSNLGQIKRISRKKFGRGAKGNTVERILKQEICNSGYLRVTLYCGGTAKRYLVHRIVGTAFAPNPDNFPEINHKDENKLNNTAENLEWCTSKYNSNYGTAKERALKNRDIAKQVENTDYKAIAKKTSKRVKQLSQDGSLIRVWKSQIQASRELGVSQGGISNCCVGRKETAGGYRWEYALQ